MSNETKTVHQIPKNWHYSKGQWGDHGEGEGGGFTIYMGDATKHSASVKQVHVVRCFEDIYEDYAEYEEAETIVRLMASAPKLLELVKAGNELQKDLKVWMHFLARDIGTDRQDKMMESCPKLIELSEKFQKLFTDLPQHLKEAVNDSARGDSKEDPVGS